MKMDVEWGMQLAGMKPSEPSIKPTAPVVEKPPTPKPAHVEKPKTPTPTTRHSSFPKSLLLARKQYPTPNDFSRKAEDITGKMTNLTINVGKGSFQAPVRNIFGKVYTEFTSAAESRAWLAGPEMKRWNQQLSLAVWLSTGGCGISPMEKYPGYMQSLIWFHVYYTTRRILSEMGAALPGEQAHDPDDNPYSEVALQRILREFGVEDNHDVRWRGGRNGGLGDSYVFYPSEGNLNVHEIRAYDVEANEWPNKHGNNLFSDEGGVEKNGNLLKYLKNSDHGGRPWLWFVLQKSDGITTQGRARLNATIQAYVYSVLGSQASMRSSILGAGGASSQVQGEFLRLVESSIANTSESESLQRMQLAIESAKLRLNRAVSPGCWMMPDTLIINTHSKISYNNELKVATDEMVFDTNDNVNTGVKHNKQHSLGDDKVNPKTPLPPIKEEHHTPDFNPPPKPAAHVRRTDNGGISTHDASKLGAASFAGLLGLALTYALH